MRRSIYNGDEDPTSLERVLQSHGQFRRTLEPFRVTPLQAGVLLFLRRHPEAPVTDSADALVVRVPTVSDLLNDLVRKRWVTKRRSVTDTRIVHLRLSWQGQARAQKLEQHVAHVNTTLTEQDRRRLGMVPKGRRV